MISLLQAIILGIIQGITEWLPVSSSGHLVIAQEYLGISVPVFYDILLHVGTLIVIVLVFWKDLLEMIKALFRLDFMSEYGRLLSFIIIGSIPTAIIGYYFQDVFMSFFTNLKVVGIALLATGALLFVSERWESNRKLNYKDSLLIGIVQGISIIPGISRSGTTISAGLLRGVKKELVAKFSFLLSIPAILGATIMVGKDFTLAELNLASLVGVAVAIIVGYISLKTLLRLITEKKFHLFAYYCWLVGAVVLIAEVL